MINPYRSGYSDINDRPGSIDPILVSTVDVPNCLNFYSAHYQHRNGNPWNSQGSLPADCYKWYTNDPKLNELNKQVDMDTNDIDVTNSYLTVFQVIKMLLIAAVLIFCSKFNFHPSKTNVSL